MAAQPKEMDPSSPSDLVPVLVSRQSTVSVSTVRDVEGVSEGSSSPVSLRRSHSQSMSDEVLGDGDSENKKFKDKDKKGFFSPRRAGALLNIFSASHRHKNSELHKIFTSLPVTELLIDDYSCALQRDILIHGRLYLTQSWICFYANIFSWETLLTIPFLSVQAITKEKTALVIPNAMQISTTTDKYGFSSLGNRDMTYNIVFKCWQNVLLNQAISPIGLVQAARKARGESTDVGTEEDLWGKSRDGDHLQIPDAQTMSLPTHLEIGLLPPTTLPLEEAAQVAQRVETEDKGSEVSRGGGARAAETNRGGAGGPDRERKAEEEKYSTPSVEPAPQLSQRPSAEVISIGGESVASSEYETISLFEDTGEITCGCSEHLGRTIINEVYDCDVETIFQLIFTETEFIKNFFKGEKQFTIISAMDVSLSGGRYMVMGDWQSNSDGSRERDLAYTISLNYSFGPKFCHTTERQVYSKMGQPGIKHIVDTEVVNHNIPYSDTFYVACRYCITRVANKKSRLRITANIKFKKSCWGLVKNLIERNVGDGVGTHYSHLDLALKEHIATLPEKSRKGGRRHRARRSSKRPTPTPVTPQTSIEEHRVHRKSLVQPPPMEPEHTTTPATSTSTHKEGSLPRINLALTLLLGILVASNVLLYHQLTGYNATTPTITPAPEIPSKNFQPQMEWPTTQQQWIDLVQDLMSQRDKEMNHWHQIITGFIYEVEKVEKALGLTKQLFLDSMENEKREHNDLYSRLPFKRHTKNNENDEWRDGDRQVKKQVTKGSMKGPQSELKDGRKEGSTGKQKDTVGSHDDNEPIVDGVCQYDSGCDSARNL